VLLDADAGICLRQCWHKGWRRIAVYGSSRVDGVKLHRIMKLARLCIRDCVTEGVVANKEKFWTYALERIVLYAD